MFSGSYNIQDVIFLLKNIIIPSTNLEDKEKLIQKNHAHYSEMITYEKKPSAKYMDIFYKSLELNEIKFAQHLYQLAREINAQKNGTEIVLASLARAGTPIGVLLNRILKELFNRKCIHYSVSIIRDRGLDWNALKMMTDNHRSEDIIFIDGWTGKGVISQELKKSTEDFNQFNKTAISSNLYVVADISGTAHWGATSEDYLIPTSILNSTISGLVSRTILNKEFISDSDFHGCIYYENLKEHDISTWFIDHMMKVVHDNYRNFILSPQPINSNKKTLEIKSLETIKYFLDLYKLNNRNFIKPGIGESTRVLLRRIPKEIWFKDRNDVNIQHILHLALEKNVPVRENSSLCYNCVAIIEDLD